MSRPTYEYEFVLLVFAVIVVDVAVVVIFVHERLSSHMTQTIALERARKYAWSCPAKEILIIIIVVIINR